MSESSYVTQKMVYKDNEKLKIKKKDKAKQAGRQPSGRRKAKYSEARS